MAHIVDNNKVMIVRIRLNVLQMILWLNITNHESKKPYLYKRAGLSALVNLIVLSTPTLLEHV